MNLLNEHIELSSALQTINSSLFAPRNNNNVNSRLQKQDIEGEVLRIIFDNNVKSEEFSYELFADLDRQLLVQEKILQIVKAIDNFQRSGIVNIHLYDIIMTYLNKQEVNDLMLVIDQAWRFCNSYRNSRNFMNFTHRLRSIICEIAFICEQMNNTQIQTILFSCINLFYNVLCHDYDKFTSGLVSLETSVSRDWFYPLINNAYSFGLVNNSHVQWLHFWALVINFYKVDFHSCSMLRYNPKSNNRMKPNVKSLVVYSATSNAYFKAKVNDYASF